MAIGSLRGPAAWPLAFPSRPAAWPVAALLAWLLLLPGCTTPAIADFRAFSTAAKEVQEGGQRVYDRAAPYIAAAAPTGPAPQAPQADCVFASLGVPCAFTPAGVGGGSQGGPPELVLRRTLLDLATTYAVLLADMAEGNAQGPSQARTAELTQLAGAAAGALTLITPAAPFAPLVAALPPLVQRLQQAQADARLRHAVIADRPTIQAVLQALEQDTPLLYRIYALGRYRDFNRGQAEATSRADAQARRQVAKQDIEQFAALLAAYVRALRATSVALDQLATAAEASGRPSLGGVASGLDQGLGFALEARRFLDLARGATATPPR